MPAVVTPLPTAELTMQEEGIPSFSVDPNAFPFDLSPFPMTGFDLAEGSMNPGLVNPQCTIAEMIHVLKQYPSLLRQHGFCSPILHYSLYEEDVPDMTTLAKSAIAVCFGSALENTDGARFARQAMTLERQRVVETFPTLSCMQQWDSLHAMMVYEILGLKVASSSAKAPWKFSLHRKGAQASFLVKMTRDFIRSHTKNSESIIFWASDFDVQSRESWSVLETARRTVFLANIVNFLTSIEPDTGKMFPYYEPLDDELILDMPLPCSHALWDTRIEEDWRQIAEYSKCAGGAGPDRDDLFMTTFCVRPDCHTLRQMFANLSKKHLETFLLANPGFDGSDGFRSFVIRCALQQFNH